MLVGRSSPLAAVPAPRPDRDTLLPLLRWLILGAALGLSVLALSRASAVGAQAPADCIPINQTSCFSNGVIYTNGTPTANIGLPSSNVVPGYVVPGIAYPYYGYGGYVAPYYRSPYYGGYYTNYYTENYGYLGTSCDPRAWWCLNYEFTGNVFANLFSPGTGAAALSTPAAAPSGTVSPSAPYRTAEIAQPAAPVAAPVAAPQAAPTTQTATALNTPTQSQAPAAQPDASVTILSVQRTTASVASNDGRDDGK